MTIKAPLRNYKQMVRIVKNAISSPLQYQLASSFGENKAPVRGTDLRLRTLEELHLPSTSQRKPGPIDHGGEFSTRVSSSYFHQLDSASRSYLDGAGGPQTQSRLDNVPGTKIRETLGSNEYVKKIIPQASLQAPVAAQKQEKVHSADNQHAPEDNKAKHQQGFSAFSQQTKTTN